MSRYWFVLVALLSVVSGLFLSALGLDFQANISWGIGTLFGFYFSAVWLFAAIRRKELGSDVLALLSIAATAITNEWLASSIIALMLSTGRALERWAEGQASKHLDALISRVPQTAHVYGASGETEDIPLTEVQLKSRVLVRSGEVVPLDGFLETEGLFDESALTGESMPIWRESGTVVDSGVVNVGNPINITTTTTTETSTYANLIRLVSSAKQQASKGVRIANVWANRFVPIALLMTLGTWIITQDAKQAVAVLVAATPCPLILAVPVAIVAGISRAAKAGVIIKDGMAVERLAQAEVVILDKTGTLTEGGAQITQTFFRTDFSSKEILMLAASLEQQSANVVGRSIVSYAKTLNLNLVGASNVIETHGHGLSGLVDGKSITVGAPTQTLPDWAPLTSDLVVQITIDNQPVGFLGLSDPIRAESMSTVSKLKELGVKRILIVSGDRKSTVDAVAKTLGVTESFAECTPIQKLEILKAEQASAKGSVLVVGDGINDAPALAASDVGIAMGARGTTAASQAASVVIVEDSIRRLTSAIAISKTSRKRALQASTIGMALALVAMAFAAFGYLNASEAAISQEFIDASSIIWALVGSSKKRPD
jgi:heavy metal translocating P-type ATPase